MISIVIPSYNSESTIELCLNALLHQNYAGAYEIILVDSSIDKTPDIVRKIFPGIKFIHLDRKTDPGTARNMGIKAAKGEIIAFIDSDCVASPDWLEKIEDAHRRFAVAAIGGSVRPANPPQDIVGWAGYIAEFREFLPELPEREVKHIPTCNISYKRRVFEQYGGFKGEYYPQEDLVFNHELREKGEKIVFMPGIQVKHYHRSHLRQFLVHQHKIGAITAKVLKVLPLEGSFIVRNRLLGFFLIPFLPAVKFFKTAGVFFRYQPVTVFFNPASLFLFGMGLLYWGSGFLGGVMDE